MQFGINGLNSVRIAISSDEIKNTGKNNEKDFTRQRKMGFEDLIYYSINRKGLCTNMETNNFFDSMDKDIDISAQSLFDQRLKLNPEVFPRLNEIYLTEFYISHKDEVKTFNGYLLQAIDGTDLEVPNTKAAKEAYGVAKNGNGGVARAGASVCYDLLNHYITDGIIDKFRAAEIEMAMENMESSEKITDTYNSIYIMDRNYVSISFMTYMGEKNLKFLCRLKSFSHYKDETSKMKLVR